MSTFRAAIQAAHDRLRTLGISPRIGSGRRVARDRVTARLAELELRAPEDLIRFFEEVGDGFLCVWEPLPKDPISQLPHGGWFRIPRLQRMLEATRRLRADHRLRAKRENSSVASWLALGTWDAEVPVLDCSRARAPVLYCDGRTWGAYDSRHGQPLSQSFADYFCGFASTCFQMPTDLDPEVGHGGVNWRGESFSPHYRASIPGYDFGPVHF